MGSGNQIPSLYCSKLWNPFPGAFEPSSRIMSGSLWTLCSALCLRDSAGASCESPVLSSNTFSTTSTNTLWCMIACLPADDPKLLLSWRRTQGTRSQWLQKRDPGLVSKLQRAVIKLDFFLSCNLLFILPASIFVVGCLTGSLVGGYQCDILGRRSYIPFFKDIW